MTPDQAKASLRKQLTLHGQDVIVRRYAGKGAARSIASSVTARARVIGYKPEELAGAVVQGDRKVIAIAEDLAALLPLLKQSDVVVIDGAETAIQAIDASTRRLAGVLVAVELQVRG